MSGHSKWSNIKRKKGVNDAKRSQEFTKVSKLITIAARDGGEDPDSNPKLRLAIDKAKHAKMPKENIDRAINKGVGKQDGSDALIEVIYEGFGPEGVAFYITGITDNKNRTVAEIKNILNKNGGSLGSPGSTSYIFTGDNFSPTFEIELSDEKAKQKTLDLIESLEEHDDVQEVYSNYKL